MKRCILKNREGAALIAMREGLPLCMLLAANPNANWRAGSAINIPPADWCENRRCTAAYNIPLMELSRRTGIPMRLILKENGLSHPAEIKKDTRLILPHIPTGSRMYTVRGAETLSEIAKNFGISEKSLLQANPDVQGIYAGLQLLIPPR